MAGVYRSCFECLRRFISPQEIEATLHCIVSVQEAIDMGQSLHLPRLFSAEILGRLPSTGHGRIRRTMLTLIGMRPFVLHGESHRLIRCLCFLVR